MAAVAKGTRLIHMDALRAGAMLFGIFVHASTIRKPNLYPLIGDFSDLFRMATFFLLSGFFTAMVFGREPARRYYPARLRLLALPLAVMLLTVVPLTNWLIHAWHNGPIGLMDYLSGGWRAPTRGNDVWHLHLWFLFSLIVYAMSMPLVAATVRRLDAAVGHRPALLTPGRLVLVLAAGCGTWAVAARAVNELAFERLLEGTGFAFIARATLQYVAFFVIGAWCFANKQVFAAMHRIAPVALALAGGGLLALRQWSGGLPAAAAKIVELGLLGALALLIIAALIGLCAKAITRPSPLLSRTVAAAYTFYLLHMTVIYVIATVVGRDTMDLHLLYWIIVAVGLPLTLALHHRLVGRSRILSLLLNGKVAPRMAPAAVADRVQP